MMMVVTNSRQKKFIFRRGFGKNKKKMTRAAQKKIDAYTCAKLRTVYPSGQDIPHNYDLLLAVAML